MCGIAGKVSSGQSLLSWSRRCARRRSTAVRTRGACTWTQGAVLGIQRLRVIDLETGDQPIYNEDGSVAVVLNGEIYNYRELREELHVGGTRFRPRATPR